MLQTPSGAFSITWICIELKLSLNRTIKSVIFLHNTLQRSTKCNMLVLQNAPLRVFCNTSMLHVAAKPVNNTSKTAFLIMRFRESLLLQYLYLSEK